GGAPAVSGCAEAAGADRRWAHPLAETMTMRHRRVARAPLARRASAAVALLTLAGALAAAVIAVLPVLVVPPVAAAGVVATVLAGWTALVCRGRRRVVGLLLAVIAAPAR